MQSVFRHFPLRKAALFGSGDHDRVAADVDAPPSAVRHDLRRNVLHVAAVTVPCRGGAVEDDVVAEGGVTGSETLEILRPEDAFLVPGTEEDVHASRIARGECGENHGAEWSDAGARAEEEVILRRCAVEEERAERPLHGDGHSLPEHAGAPPARTSAFPQLQDEAEVRFPRRRRDGVRARLDICGILEEWHREEDELSRLIGEALRFFQCELVDVASDEAIVDACGLEGQGRHCVSW
ncbi:hypothetical protein A2947_00600 [Candidatus Peribacteria bacterium RIFCSPLOWO2_01_FULL_54_110]|nr:MAG: hypothetical protein A3E47_01715 [Candidatus Peribacteria bacterium RIFCSPHIGHO2_12_FULL_54_10]OGJ67642.1 MAG: hypothetical protein A2947_00600 [Candidatus Peribacteria bacterium RIFCSPLOWO2_01_FULL_54_110]